MADMAMPTCAITFVRFAPATNAKFDTRSRPSRDSQRDARVFRRVQAASARHRFSPGRASIEHEVKALLWAPVVAEPYVFPLSNFERAGERETVRAVRARCRCSGSRHCRAVRAGRRADRPFDASG